MVEAGPDSQSIRDFFNELADETRRTPQEMQPYVQKFTDDFIDTVGELKRQRQGNVEEFCAEKEIPGGLISKIMDKIGRPQAAQSNAPATTKEPVNYSRMMINSDERTHNNHMIATSLLNEDKRDDRGASKWLVSKNRNGPSVITISVQGKPV